MKKILSKIFRVRYFMVALLLGTILILILNPNYLYDKAEYFKTEYSIIEEADFFALLPKNPFFDIVYLNENENNIFISYYNFKTGKLKQTELLGKSIISPCFVDTLESSVFIILNSNRSDYFLFELYNKDNSFEIKSNKIFSYNIYKSLLDSTITIKNKKFFPIKIDKNAKNKFKIERYEDGYKLSFSKSLLDSLNAESFNFIKQKISNKLMIDFTIDDFNLLINFFRRNSYYQNKYFSNPLYKKKGFFSATILGKIDADNDEEKEILIQIGRDRWIKGIIICYSITKREIIWKKEFTQGFENYLILDIDNDDVDEILLSWYSPCNEMPIDFNIRNLIGTTNRSYFFVLNNKGELKKINGKPVIINSSPGFYEFKFIPILENNKILLGLKSDFDNSEKKLISLDFEENKIDTLEICYNSILDFYREKNQIIGIIRTTGSLEKYIINLNLTKARVIRNNFPFTIYDIFISNCLNIDNKIYSIWSPNKLINENFNVIFEIDHNITNKYSFEENSAYFIEDKNNNRSFLSCLNFSRNKTLNPYLFIIILTELLIILLYFFVYHHIKIPMVSTTSSYFILYSFFGKLYYWKLQGRLKTIYKLPKKMSVNEETPINILNEISDDNELRYQRDFFLLKYKVFEISSTDEFQIIQRISHDLKNQVLMTKLMTEQYETDLEIKNKDFIDNMFSSLKDISSSAVMLSNFSHINKLYKEKVEIKSFIESIISQYVNHPLFERICHSVKSRTQSRELSQRQTNDLSSVVLTKSEESTTECLSEELSQRQTNEESTIEERSFEGKASRISQDDIIANIDKSLFQIAFKNLLNNALEAIDENGYVRVEISEIKNDVVIEIRNSFDKLDSSCKPESGLSTEKIQEVGFSTKEKGSGLGIPISKTIIEKHDGTLSINCENNEFTVTVILPKINKM